MAIEHVTPTRDELLDELAQELADPEIPEGAITVTMLSKQVDRSIWTIRKFLERKVKAGKMEYVVAKNRERWYYLKGE